MFYLISYNIACYLFLVPSIKCIENNNKIVDFGINCKYKSVNIFVIYYMRYLFNLNNDSTSIYVKSKNIFECLLLFSFL